MIATGTPKGSIRRTDAPGDEVIVEVGGVGRTGQRTSSASKRMRRRCA
ncbi:hypothetical protein [Enterobacter hormaechei]